ncbi:MAG: GNAT family N-acetyltransferase [Gemmatimonadaceae bacterium]
MTDLRIRPAAPRDSESIAVLLGQLGYPARPEDIPRRLEALNNFSDAIAMVAEDHRGVVGIVTAHVFPSIHSSELRAWLTTIVVFDVARGEGVGSKLVSYVEDWAAARNVPTISVSSGKQRERTHKFYQERGYEWTGLRFTKTFAEPMEPAR